MAADRPPLASQLTRPLREFLATEVAGGVVLLGATVVALVWANCPWRSSYRTVWTTPLRIALGRHVIVQDLRHWLNDGLMSVFFLVAGLEIKRELVEGELRDRRRALLPVIAAAGGMAAPALIYLAFNPRGAASHGWGIPMATDIAFALGAVALLGRRVPPSLRLFLLALAIVDDIGALVIIAAFYSTAVSWPALAVAAGLVGVVVLLRAIGVWWTPAYVLVGAGVWLATYDAGVNATVAGVVMGLLAPTAAAFDPERTRVGTVDWLEHVLHPWASFLIVPLFVVANAGVSLGPSSLRGAFSSGVGLGVLFGKVAGKVVGISIAAWLACRLKVAALPDGVRWRQLIGVAAVAGVGFTVSLFFTDLAFASTAIQDQAKVAVLAGSVIAPLLGWLVLSGRRSGTAAQGPQRHADASSQEV